MSKFKILSIILLLLVGLFIQAKPAFAATCAFKLNPDIVSLTPTYKKGADITVTSGDLVNGEYRLEYQTPEMESKNNWTNTSYQNFTRASGATYRIGKEARVTDPVDWVPGKYLLQLRARSTGKIECTSSDFNFTIPEQPAQPSCSLSIANSRQPVQVGEDVIINVSGLEAKDIGFTKRGGYQFYVYHDKDSTNTHEAEGYDGSGQIKLNANEWFGSSSKGKHTFAIRQNCFLNYGCYEFLQCNKLPIIINPETKPRCQTTKTDYESNETIQVNAEFLREGNHTYFTDIYKYPGPGSGGFGTIAPVGRDSGKTDINGRVNINLDNALNALEGTYTVSIVDVKSDGTVTEACPTPQFNVKKFTPAPPNAIQCKVTAANEDADVLLTVAFGDGVDLTATYIPVIDGAEKAGGTPNPATKTLNLNLGTFPKDSPHIVNLKGNLCTNDEKERTFQTKAAATAAPIVPHCTDAEKAAGKCTKGGGESCDEGKGIKTAVGCIHTNPAEFVKDFMTFAIGIGGGLAFLMMLLGSFQMLTSSGNPDTLKAGQDRLTSAVIGLLFVIFAVLLLQIIGFGILKIPDFNP